MGCDTIELNLVWCFFFEKIKILNFYQNTQNCFAYISATKYCSEAVLYSKRRAACPLSPHILTNAVAFYELSNKATKLCFLKVLEKTPTLGVQYTPFMEKIGRKQLIL